MQYNKSSNFQLLISKFPSERRRRSVLEVTGVLQIVPEHTVLFKCLGRLWRTLYRQVFLYYNRNVGGMQTCRETRREVS